MNSMNRMNSMNSMNATKIIETMNIPDNVWWRKTTSSTTNRHMCDEIDAKLDIVRKHVEISDESSQLFIKDIVEFTKRVYVAESLVCEGNIIFEGGTMDMCCTVSLHDHVETIMLLGNTRDTRDTRVYQKVINMYKAITHGFSNTIFSYFNPKDLVPELAMSLHRTIGNKIILDAGCYRTIEVAPCGSSYRYVESIHIRDEMEVLFTTTSSLLVKFQHLTSQLIRLGAYFLCNFLRIHPFSNGNGRVARILLSLIMSSVSIMPLSLYSHKNIYIECLIEARRTMPNNPESLATFILECLYKNTCDLCYLLS
jgi:fido (protein-threonine AMPylation protein)